MCAQYEHTHKRTHAGHGLVSSVLKLLLSLIIESMNAFITAKYLGGEEEEGEYKKPLLLLERGRSGLSKLNALFY